MNEQPIGKVELKKELLIAAWFWIAALATGVVLALALAQIVVPDMLRIHVDVRRTSAGVSAKSDIDRQENLEQKDREKFSVLLMGCALMTAIAWAAHKRRFSLSTILILVFAVALIGAAPRIKLGNDNGYSGYVTYIFQDVGPLTDTQALRVTREFYQVRSIVRIPAELENRLAKYRIEAQFQTDCVGYATILLTSSYNVPRADMENVTAYHAQLMDLFIRDSLTQPDKHPSAKITGESEWSRRWAPTFEADYRARKAALPAEASAAASKKEKNASSAP